MARRGTRWIDEPGEGEATKAWREAVREARSSRRPDGPEDEVWIDEGVVEEERPSDARDAPTGGRPRRGPSLPKPVSEELEAEAPAGRVPRLQQRLADAVRAYERDRYPDALRLLRKLAEEAPGAASVRELLGLTYYRMGRWRQAVTDLEAFRTLTGSYDQHPTLADCYRALRRYDDVEALWDDLRTASPDAALVAEGRIVAAGSLADQGRLADAIALLAKASKPMKRPQPHHLRLWFALADLYERAGDLPQARALFARVADHDPELSDVRARLKSLA